MKCSRTLPAGFAGVLVCAVLVLCGGRTAVAFAETDQPLAVIGSVKVTEKDFRSEMDRGGYGLSGRFERPEQREALLEDMVRSEVLYATAIKDGYDRRPVVLDALKRIIINHYRQDHLDRELSKITVTEDEIRAFYNEQASEYSTPQMVRAAVIEIAVPAKASDEKRAEFQKKAEDARADALSIDPAVLSFGSVAVKYSDDQVGRYRGGDTGLMKRADAVARWGKEIADAIFSITDPGQISPVIVSPAGFYVVKLMERKESVRRPLAEVNEIIRSRLFFEKKVQKEKEFYGKLSAALNVEINRDLLGKIPLPAGGPRFAPPALPRQ
ncbi:MAG: peptidyl-prolyl cis-trans isomerase [Nitrospirae bacterium]|nr:peptidyl-prolyl cis-trans isomerase [Nitrospirota bacterium]